MRHVLTSACEQTHFHCSNTRIETLPSHGRGANSVRTMHDMMQCQKESVKSLGIKFSMIHLFFALLAHHSEWPMSHLVRSDFQVEADERVVKTSPNECHTGNPAPRATKLLNRIWGWTATIPAGLDPWRDWWWWRGDTTTSRWDTAPSWRIERQSTGKS